MAGLQRFISYIYKYESDEKKANVGFAKVEVRNGTCRMEIHIRNINIAQTEGMVYFFIRKENKMFGIPVGNIPIIRGNGDVRYTFDIAELQNFGVGMEQTEGIFISLSPRIYLASQWKEGELAENRFQVLEKNLQEDLPKEAVKEEIESGEIESKEIESGEIESKEIESGEIESEEIESKEIAPTDSVNEETINGSVHTTEIPMEQFFEEENLFALFQKLRLKFTIFYPFEGQSIECIRLEIKDLREFPEKHWYLGNNSFLLHGFFGYGHFIFGEIEESGKKEYFVGVPGIFSNQERIMAAMFGFPEFRTAKNVEYKTGNFGYWYRII